MFMLERNTVRLGARPADKTGAIRETAQLLINAGYITPAYADSMLGREKQANTYLGNGIAIPHGMLDDKDKILKTGVAVLQVPDGVEWNPGETAYLVVGIAARSDEHLEVLANLTDVLGDEAVVRQLATTGDVDAIVTRLNGGGDAAQPAPPAGVATSSADTVRVVLPAGAGLHARPATMFVETAKQFEARVEVRSGNRVADGKSMISLLRLGAAAGAELVIAADGPDAPAALQALRAAVESGLGEGAGENEHAAPVAGAAAWTPRDTLTTIDGIAASPGLAIGPVFQYTHTIATITDRRGDPAVEEPRLRGAIAGAKAELDELYEDVRSRSGEGRAAIFRAHGEFLGDPELQSAALARVRDGHDAAWSWNQEVQERVTQLRSLDDPLLANRAVDLQDVGMRVLRQLGAVGDTAPALPPTPIVLVADDLTPSDTARLDPQTVLGFCTARGGPTSHTAIIARSLDIPAIVGAGPGVLKVPDGTIAVLDGGGGALYLDPSPADLEAARAAQQNVLAEREAERLQCYEPAITTDGHRVEVVANVAAPEEAQRAVDAGAEGIGLFRTEFLFLDRDGAPSEEEQFAAYSEVTRALNGLPAIIRTLDIGGDKNVPYLDLPSEDNPFLGVRGIRLCFARPDLFRAQLRAILRAASSGPLRIMYPMIASLDELRRARQMTEEVRAELDAPPVEIGIMVEVPSAVLVADELAAEADFFSIGTNDLTQYVLAMDRLHPMLAKQADGLHPAVLRAIDATVRAASAKNKWVGVCGGIAGDPRGALILVGLGVTELSVSIPSVAAIKAAMRRTSLERAQQLAQQALRCTSAAEVRALPIGH